ncbi:hypothetical protein I552_5072 [Mycobacterium xenopi 3993]|nr:hypothetical protein I552_5072 [Mycobacterium xenopi 3993]
MTEIHPFSGPSKTRTPLPYRPTWPGRPGGVELHPLPDRFAQRGAAR